MWSDLLHGPFHVILLLCQLVPHGATSSGEITEAQRVYHDGLGADLHTLRFVYGSVKDDPDWMPDARLQGYLIPKVSKEWEAFLSTAVTREAIAARDSGLQWQWHVHGHDQLSADFASQECALIVREFVRNAIKYADRTKPDRWIRISWDAATRTLTIADNGVGIANTTAVWEHGTRERPDLADGTGLGLYSLRRRAEANGWVVGVTSTLGEGSVFTLQLKPSDMAA